MMTILAEHHVLYQYMLKGARNHYMGLIQTETVSTCGINIVSKKLNMYAGILSAESSITLAVQAQACPDISGSYH